MTGVNIDILPAELEGGWKNDAFYLPASFSILPSFEENLNFFIYRTVYLCIQSEQGFNWNAASASHTIEESRAQALVVSIDVIEEIKSEYPSVYDYLQKVRPSFTEIMSPAYWLFGKFMTSRDVIENTSPDDLNKKNQAKNSVNPSTEIKSKPVEEVEIISVDKKAQEDYMLTHNFEKAETAEEFTGVWRGFDGDDNLKEDSDALNEINLKHLIRTDEVAQSIYQSDFRDLKYISESKDSEDSSPCELYNEWDFSKAKYKIDYCKVYLEKVKGGDLTYAKLCLQENKKILSSLRRKFAQVHQTRRTVKKLQDGEQIDLDTLVDWFADLHSGRTPSDRIYLSKRKKGPDLAILFLLDLSMSSDSYASGNRILDVEKQAVILFGEVLSEYQVDFAVGGFYSKTRNNCVYHMIKDFGESWTIGKQNIGAVEPQGYTRIGPALRHARKLIESHTAKQKWVILLSDGKPNDYDKYEGKYGVKDVKQALREMHERHISTYAIAIESVARYYLPQMFGQNHYNILSHPDMMIFSLATLFRRINNL